MTKTVVMKEVRKIKDPLPLANVVYKHFEYLSAFPNLSHTIPQVFLDGLKFRQNMFSCYQ